MRFVDFNCKYDNIKGRNSVISKTIDPSSFAAVEEYWEDNIAIPSILSWIFFIKKFHSFW